MVEYNADDGHSTLLMRIKDFFEPCLGWAFYHAKQNNITPFDTSERSPDYLQRGCGLTIEDEHQQLEIEYNP
jgi:hypothetical protein